ncbi:hypothetical protein GO755_25470 [Spirosoma sp. HMF4905]|uniref:Uncharacterized protein n=1 Tax=Spirosoma arboris TaxID=2682092 RepID=A0A7K1SI76_9BACT|nr:hypothetical protein [Spirosoma arboris]MVM33414.1 hypothetical protein [Spirosoma arboris]
MKRFSGVLKRLMLISAITGLTSGLTMFNSFEAKAQESVGEPDKIQVEEPCVAYDENFMPYQTGQFRLDCLDGGTQNCGPQPCL